MKITALDHLVLTVADIDATASFYARLGARREEFGEGRVALRFGIQKLNLHQAGAEVPPHARSPAPGSADLCFLTSDPIEQVRAELIADGLTIELGPVRRMGATRAIYSLYLRDPDGNLVELSHPLGH
jgi:catechol 2,3-dioxygenase-like lactoylglutathione lyase family enzyme